jgi:hypothetical protein
MTLALFKRGSRSWLNSKKNDLLQDSINKYKRKERRPTMTMHIKKKAFKQGDLVLVYDSTVHQASWEVQNALARAI